MNGRGCSVCDLGAVVSLNGADRVKTRIFSMNGLAPEAVQSGTEASLDYVWGSKEYDMFSFGYAWLPSSDYFVAHPHDPKCLTFINERLVVLTPLTKPPLVASNFPLLFSPAE